LNHSLVKATLIPEIVQMISVHYGLDEDAALESFYQSGIARALADDETGLYAQSALYIFSLYEVERGMSTDHDK
jgi:hypothetical protein